MKKKCMVYFCSLISFVFVLAGLVITNNAAAQNQMFVPGQVFTQNGVYSRYSLEVSPIHDPSTNLEKSINDERSAPGGFNKINPTDGSDLVAPWSTSLEWSNSSSADIYAYCIDTTDDDTCTENNWVSTGTATEVELSGLGLLPGTTYFWQVRARNTSGMTEADEGFWWQFTTVVPPAPGEFYKISPPSDSMHIGDVTLEWSLSQNALSYEYCIDTTPDNTCTDNDWISTGTALEVELRLIPGTTYYWQVRARNYGGTTEADEGSWWYFTTTRYYYLPLLLY